MITGIAHVCFHTTDLVRSLRFYQDGLGFQHAFDFFRDTGERHGCYLHIGERTFIELFQRPIGDRAERQPFSHFCLEVDRINATVDALRARGIEATDPKLGSDNAWQSWIVDPDGNRIELHQYTPESKQRPFLA